MYFDRKYFRISRINLDTIKYLTGLNQSFDNIKRLSKYCLYTIITFHNPNQKCFLNKKMFLQFKHARHK